MIRKAWGYLLVMFVLASIGQTAAEEKWNEMKSRHFIVYYKNTPRGFAETVLNNAEQCYDAIVDNLGFNSYKGWTFDDRAKIYVYDNKDDYVTSAQQANWSAGTAYYLKRTIRTYPSAAGFFDTLLPHELGHIIFHEFIGHRGNIPLWFDEGVAMYQEKAKRWGANGKVQQALKDGTFIPLSRLAGIRLQSDSSRDLIELFYDESASIIYFLITEYGDFKFLNFCRNLERGDDFLHSLERSYPRFKTLDELNAAWVSYLEKN
ncbi:MAG: peptidase MA family metallohydrolase [Candidatus Omnitrophota bacterium]